MQNLVQSSIWKLLNDCPHELVILRCLFVSLRVYAGVNVCVCVCMHIILLVARFHYQFL